MSIPITSIDQVMPDWLPQVFQAGDYLNDGRIIAIQPADQQSTTTDGPGFNPSQRISSGPGSVSIGAFIVGTN